MALTASPHDPSLQLLHAPVVVVGAVRDGQTGGLTAAWVSRVSIEPPLVAVSVAPTRHTHGLLAPDGRFTLSILHEDQLETARLFGLHSGRDRDKWAETPHVLMGGDCPAVAGCSARLLCRVVGRCAAGDHELFIGEVVESVRERGGPALPMRGSDFAPRA